MRVTTVTINIATLTKLRVYLGKRPYDEVAEFVAPLEQEFQASVESQVAEAAKASNVVPFPGNENPN